MKRAAPGGVEKTRDASGAETAKRALLEGFAFPALPSTALLGGLLALLVVAVGLAGLPMILRYEADPARAHESVRALTQGAWGWLRGFHAWAAVLVVLLALVHPLSVWLRGGSWSPSRRVWVTGTLILGVLLFTYLTGTVLRFDHRGWEALEHLDQGLAVVGLGMLEEGEPSSARLDLFFWFHVLVVPLLLVALLVLHLARGSGWKDRGRRVLVFARRSLRPGLMALAVVALFALLFPPRFGPAPLPGLEVTNPPWLFLWLVPLQDLFGSAALWVLPVLLIGVAALPWFAGGWTRRGRVASVSLLAGILLVLTLSTILGGTGP